MAVTSAYYDAAVEQSMARSALMLRDHGATDEEVEAVLAQVRADRSADRENHLAQLRQWLDDPQAPAALQ